MADKNIHGGHRQRMKDRFLKNGADVFEKHQLLELLLFYGIPQRDTNPTAHALLNRFGSMKGIFEASIEDLCEVEGISNHTATLIKLVPALFSATVSEPDDSVHYDSLSKIGELLVKKYATISVETVFLVLMDASWHILDIVNLGEGSVNQVRLDTRKLVEVVIRRNASRVLLAHNHPNGSVIPSSEDIVTTEEVARVMKTIHVEFLEHLLIAGGRYEPLLTKTERAFWQKSDRAAFYK